VLQNQLLVLRHKYIHLSMKNSLSVICCDVGECRNLHKWLKRTETSFLTSRVTDFFLKQADDICFLCRQSGRCCRKIVTVIVHKKYKHLRVHHFLMFLWLIISISIIMQLYLGFKWLYRLCASCNITWMFLSLCRCLQLISLFINVIYLITIYVYVCDVLSRRGKWFCGIIWC
jgi:hypothetical protein